jgi:hypothetical protein
VNASPAVQRALDALEAHGCAPLVVVNRTKSLPQHRAAVSGQSVFGRQRGDLEWLRTGL